MHHRNVAGFLTGILLAGLAVAQPVQWRVEDGGNGHWYEGIRHSTYLRWSDARAFSMGRGGHLATLTSTEETVFVRQYASSRPELWQNIYGGPWIGAYQDLDAADYSEPAGGWKWVTSEPWNYQNWVSGEPNNNAGSPEHWAHLVNFSGQWNDFADESIGPLFAQTTSYLVEWSADCNNDGIVDKGQILSGELPDANNNGIPDGGPTITSQPVDQNVDVDTPVTFIVEVANDPACTAFVTFQWQRRNPLVADQAAPGAWIDLADGSGFLNTRGSGLIIVRPTPGLATGYRCKMSGGCGGCDPGPGGFIYTNTVNFTIACPADFNADGGVDFGDVEEFFTRWENGC
jgi:hypothetical protein